MAASRDVEENHWPGFVDALTTMTMMLIFIMTILTVVIFSLSQTASRYMVEKVAKVVNIGEIDDKEGAEELMTRIIAKLDASNQATMMAQAPAQPKAEEPEGQRLQSTAEAGSMPVQSAKVDASPTFLTVTYQRRATGLDEDTRRQIRTAMTDSDSLRKTVELKAFADRATAVSDSRRIAFYRLLNLRTELIALGVPADRIRAKIEESQGISAPDLVRVSLASAG
jgi:chemotaxis protein MotB